VIKTYRTSPTEAKGFLKILLNQPLNNTIVAAVKEKLSGIDTIKMPNQLIKLLCINVITTVKTKAMEAQ